METKKGFKGSIWEAKQWHRKKKAAVPQSEADHSSDEKGESFFCKSSIDADMANTIVKYLKTNNRFERRRKKKRKSSLYYCLELKF